MEQLLALPTYSVPAWVCHFYACDVYLSFSEILVSLYHTLAHHDQAKPYNESAELHEFHFFHWRPTNR